MVCAQFTLCSEAHSKAQGVTYISTPCSSAMVLGVSNISECIKETLIIFQHENFNDNLCEHGSWRVIYVKYILGSIDRLEYHYFQITVLDL